MDKPKLTIELIPERAWGVNLRSELPKEEWDRLRRQCYLRAGYACEVCGGHGPQHPVECHEVWEWDRENLIQRLKGLVALCPACHEVKHYGRTDAKGCGCRARRHLAEVNDWSELKVWSYISQVEWEFQEIRDLPWTIDLSWLDTLKNPPLRSTQTCNEETS
jgi:hypothetical protein